jgi:hypothetical protein
MQTGLSTVASAKTVPSGGIVSRVRRRLFPPSTAVTPALPKPAGRGLNFQASIAEFLLVNRLKARSRRDQAAVVLERASHIVFVTCKNWFGDADQTAAQRRGNSHHQTRL